MASLDLEPPFSVLATVDLGAPIASLRCARELCVVTHGSPTDALSIVDATDLSFRRLALEAGSDPRDVAILDATSLLVTYGERAYLDRVTLPGGARSPIDLTSLADADGLPEAGRMALCDGRVFVQLARVDHDTGAERAARCWRSSMGRGAS
jgi:hypothetical protein